jgi:hypothetical protein
MMTYQQIYESLFEDTGDRFTLYKVMDVFKKESDWVGSPFQLMKIKELVADITGIRPGNCSGCNIDALKNFMYWIERYELQVKTEHPKKGRPKKV